MDGLGLLTYVKRVLHSLVVSSPLQMTIEKLQRDYFSEEGCNVPFNRLGFQDIESFLRSIPDTITIIGYGPMAYVAAVTNIKTAHIQSLVQSQKKPSSRARNRSLRYKPKYFFNSKQSDIVFVNEHYVSNHKNQNNNQNQKAAYYNKVYESGHSRAKQNENRDPSNDAVADERTDKLTQAMSKVTIANVDDELSSDEDLQSEIFVRNEEILANEAEQVDGTGAPVNGSVETGLENETSHQLASEESVDEHAYESSDDCNGSDDDAIPAYAVDERVFQVDYPKEVVRCGFKLPEHKVKTKLNLGDRIKVQLVKVNTPHSFNFWMHDDHYDQYKAMSNNMQQFYNDLAREKFIVPTYLIMEGHLCAVRSKCSIWERAEICSIELDRLKNKVDVKLIDTGEILAVCHNALRFLHKDFADLPPQYMVGRLSYVAPWLGSAWSLEAINYFYTLVRYRMLFARIELVNEVTGIVHMVLVDPDAESPTRNVNVALVESGWARRAYTA